MSCNRQSNQVRQASRAAGVSGLSSQMSNITGGMVDKATAVIDQTGRTAAPLAKTVLGVIAPANASTARKQAALARSGLRAAQGLALAGLGLKMATRAPGKILPVYYTTRRVIQASEGVTGALGTGLAALSQTDKAGTALREKRSLLFFKSKQPVSLWKSRLTPLLNRRNVMASGQIETNEGVMFTLRGTTWHRGTVTFETEQGRRTITQLQSLQYPQNQHFFDRQISDQHAVDLAAGQVKPETIPGFAGRVSKTEALCPAWAGVKKAMILTHLNWSLAREVTL